MSNNSDKNCEIVIELKNVTKTFGDFVANDNISLQLRKGEIHAILGENGAGKSTLMNQISGLLKPTSGEIYVYGQKVDFEDSNDAAELGIGMVHQHFMLVDEFSVTENIILGKEPKKKFTVDMVKAKKDVIQISKEYGLQVDPDAKVEDISVGMQQRVEILKALYRGAKILILDEPTASLTPQEIDELINVMKKLAENGSSILLITHKLNEIKRAADRCTIIRKGKYIDTVNVDEVTENELAEKMVGREVTFKVDKKNQEPKDVVLSIKNLHALNYKKVEALKGLDLEVREGEIVGIAGIDGNGQTELAEVLTGLRKATSGEVTLKGIDILNKTPKYDFDNGVSNIPADRLKRGLVLDFSIKENLIIQNVDQKKFSQYGFLNNKNIDDFANTCIERYDIRSHNGKDDIVNSLSGGNQQKVIIAREIENDKELLIAFNPTRGLDVGAIEFIDKYLVLQRDKYRAVLLISFELDEIMNLSDRIVVMFDGKINYEVKGCDANENTLGLMMSGGK